MFINVNKFNFKLNFRQTNCTINFVETYNRFTSSLSVSFSNCSFLANIRFSFVIILSIDPGILNVDLFIKGNNL